MSLAEFKPIPLPKLGGLFTFLKPVDVPTGYSPALQNVRFLPRAVLSRNGLTARMSKANKSFLGVAQFISNIGGKTLLSLDSDGTVDFQSPTAGTPVQVMANAADAGSMMSYKIAFGRVFLSFFNPDLSPAGPIRQWSGNQQTLAPAAPGNVVVADSVTVDANWAAGATTYKVQVLFECVDGSFLVASIPATWNSAGGLAPTVSTIPIGAAIYNVVARWVCFSLPNTSTPLFRFPQFRIADNITTSATLAGVGATGAAMRAAGANTDQLISGSVNVPCLSHIAPDGPAVAPAAADSANAGSVVVGTHMVWVAFETQYGFITALSPAGSWSAAGGFKAVISAIPIGPWYVKARRLFFSSVDSADAFYVSTFRIPNNSTTSVEVDFTDTNLLQGSNFNYLTKNFSMPPAIGVSTYGGRLVTWGALNTVKFTNAGFDGGFNLTTGAPLGWVLDGGFGAGGDKEVFGTYAGDAWRMTADGVTSAVGHINNSSIAALLDVNIPYSVSIRARGDANFTAGFITLKLSSASLGTLGTFRVLASSLTTAWKSYSGSISLGLASVPSDLVLQVRLDGTPVPANNRAWVDHISFFPTNNDQETSVLRLSNPFDTETFDGVNGLQFISKDNGEQITAATQLRSFLYVHKERSMHVTYDDTINPPSIWIIRQIDSTIGTGSPRSIVSSDTFIAFSSRGGAYMFTGARPQKVSQEIQTTWSQTNWSASATTHTVLDAQSKTILFFLPFGTDTAPKNSLILDYSEGVGQEDDPGPRKWGKDAWPNAINASLKFENSSVTQTLNGAVPNTQAIYLAGTKIYEYAGLDDDGVDIDWFYETAFLKAGDTGQDLFGGATFYAEGSGALLVTLIGLDDVLQATLQTQALSAAPGTQYEVYANTETERAKIRFEQKVEGTFATIKGVTLLARPWAEQRPH